MCQSFSGLSMAKLCPTHILVQSKIWKTSARIFSPLLPSIKLTAIAATWGWESTLGWTQVPLSSPWDWSIPSPEQQGLAHLLRSHHLDPP